EEERWAPSVERAARVGAPKCSLAHGGTSHVNGEGARIKDIASIEHGLAVPSRDADKGLVRGLDPSPLDRSFAQVVSDGITVGPKVDRIPYPGGPNDRGDSSLSGRRVDRNRARRLEPNPETARVEVWFSLEFWFLLVFRLLLSFGLSESSFFVVSTEFLVFGLDWFVCYLCWVAMSQQEWGAAGCVCSAAEFYGWLAFESLLALLPQVAQVYQVQRYPHSSLPFEACPANYLLPMLSIFPYLACDLELGCLFFFPMLS
ncbi:hypothetical protein U1Q18_032316, partial [Sarracenia purpurea var. burkii]